ncbi:MAG TPA: DUF6541 family protein, partial [Candidatus Nanopelagicales bacterium]|nr:DUF6541 family protein [Candidatus Nanopelagicales bacterium]
VLSVLHLAVTPLALIVAVLLVPLVTVVVVRRGRLPEVRDTLNTDRWDVAALVLIGAMVVAQWWFATRGLSAVPPRDDGTNHGLYVARILATHSVDPGQVLVGDVITGAQQWSYYPLALHTVAAMVAGLGIPVGTAINAVWVTIVAVAMPLGMHVLARRTFTARRAALGAALIVVLVPAMPTGQLAWGGLAVVAGLALAPSVADEVLGLLDVDHPTRAAELGAGLALGLAVVGMFSTHSSELVTVAVIVLCLLLGDRVLRPMLARWRVALLPGAVALVVLVAVTLPWLGDIRTGAGERYLVAASHDMPLGSVADKLAGYAFGPVPVAWLLGALALGGAVLAWRRGAAGWLWLAGVVVLLSTAVGMSWPGADLVGSPWYSNLNRTALMLTYPTAALAGYGTWWLARSTRDALGRVSPHALATAAGLVVVAVVAGLLVRTTYVDAATAYAERDDDGTGRSLVTADAIDSWGWLAAHASPQERILNAWSDGSGWMYAQSGLAPVVPQKLEPDQLADDRGYLLQHASAIGSDARASGIASRLRVRYAYVGPRWFPSSPDPWFTAQSLIDGGWTVVHRNGSTVVLERPGQD